MGRKPRRRDEMKRQPQPDAAERSVQAHLSVEWQGILPHPNDLERYEHLIPGSAARLLDLVEGQTRHRQGLERLTVESNIRRSWAGLWVGGALTAIGLFACLLAILKGASLEGVAGVIIALVLLSGTFIYTNERRITELRDRVLAILGHGPPG